MAVSLSTCSTVAAATTVALILLANTVPTTEGANILIFIGFGGPSHKIAMMPYANGLVDEGHNVTFVAKEKPKEKDPKIHHYVPTELSNHFTKMGAAGTLINLYDLRANPMKRIFVPWFRNGITVCEKLYEDAEFVIWLKSAKFDLVIVDALFNECAYGIAHVLKAKTMMFSVSSVLPWSGEPLGLPDESSTIPDMMFQVPIQMNFFNRLVTAVTPIMWKYMRGLFYFPKLHKITKEGLGVEDFPCFADLERNISLALINTHVAQEFPRSLPPNVVPVGGISWVVKKKPLPKEMEDFINRGKEGFVYVSFGSFIDFLSFPPEVQQKFINALLKFPNIQFIWKLSKTPDNLPKNFYVDKWLPQIDLLLHPKIRAFVTHSGIGGVNEAIYSAVPLICFPVIAEQDYNAQLIEQKGIGIKMEITDFTEDEMENALHRILGDKRFSENMKRVAKQFQDRPHTPLQTGLWWTNFILRQEDTDYIRPPSVNQSWWVKRQIDVWIFLIVFLISVNSLTIYIFVKLVKRCCFRGSSDAKKVSSGTKSKKGKAKLN
ncbi:unnamed protein product [Orchesella dallaii]|uniref:UDP-glucuronosyltransferase n=1 Tax=Orchesella dallaii TaxID=48710 RepID=A0ABP1S5X2_9HEXA